MSGQEVLQFGPTICSRCAGPIGVSPYPGHCRDCGDTLVNVVPIRPPASPTPAPARAAGSIDFNGRIIATENVTHVEVRVMAAGVVYSFPIALTDLGDPHHRLVFRTGELEP